MSLVNSLIRPPCVPKGLYKRQMPRTKGVNPIRSPAQKRPSVNFTDSKPSVNDIFNLDKNINSGLQWENVHKFLNDRGGLMSVTKGAAEKLVVEAGYTCVDVRTGKGFEEGLKIKDAVNVPLFKDLDSSASLDAAARKVFFTLLPGVEGTFYNEKFVDDVLSAVRSKEAPIILSCARGGLVHKSKYYPKGIASRSLIAAAILIKAGFTNIAHVNGGTGEVSKLNPMDRNILLEFIYGKELPAGTTSPMLMRVSYSIVLGYLAYLIIPKLPQATIDMAERAGWM